MKQNLINEVIQGMLPFLNNAQTEKLQEVLQHTLFNYTVSEDENKEAPAEQNLVESFLAAKRIEGCSEKSLKYYDATITSLLTELGKDVKHIVTDDIRTYLTDYQARKKSSKVTIDNIRRILSSFGNSELRVCADWNIHSVVVFFKVLHILFGIWQHKVKLYGVIIVIISLSPLNNGRSIGVKFTIAPHIDLYKLVFANQISKYRY